MASLYSPSISNEDLLLQKNLRHKRLNLDYEYTSAFPYQDISVFSNLSWQTVDFNRINVSALNPVRGIYMYTFNPHNFSMLGFSSNIVLYIGQASNLRTRVAKYFTYPNSIRAADQERRFMILFLGDYLQLNYYEAPHLNPQQLDVLEHDLIDSILPPFNLRVYSQWAQQYRRILP
jgi:hypothetical protein